MSIYIRTHVALCAFRVNKGEPPMINDMPGGQIPVGIGTLGTMAPHIESAKVLALAVIGARRLKNHQNLLYLSIAAAAKDTAMNPAVVDAVALAICAAQGPPGYRRFRPRTRRRVVDCHH